MNYSSHALAVSVAGIALAMACGRGAPPASSAAAATSDELSDARFARYLRDDAGVDPQNIDAAAREELRRAFQRRVLFARAAAAEHLTIDPLELQEEVDRLKSSGAESDPVEVERLARERLMELAYEREALLPLAQVSEAEVTAALAGAAQDAGAEVVRCRVIVTDDRRTADAVRRRLANPRERFAVVAKEVSRAPDHGALRDLPLAHLPPQAARLLRKARAGEIVGPVEIDGAWYLFEPAGRRRVDPARPLDQRAAMQQKLQADKLDRLRAARLAELSSKVAPLQQGGGR